MCGIVGYIGLKNCTGILINGLSKLEYRGYDSAGVSIHNGNNIKTVKTKGRVSFLQDKLTETPINGFLGIGHTRWATHGVPSDTNSHPQNNFENSISVVHNGIIENYISLKEELISEGYTFSSETDTETIVHLIDFYYKSGLSFEDAIFKTTERLEGAYALGIVCKHMPEILFAAKKDSPLVIGVGDNENFIASDVSAILNHTKNIYLLEDNEISIIKKASVEIYDKNKNIVKREIFKVDWDLQASEKGGFEHFMLKEIYEQPKVVKDTMLSRLKDTYVNLDQIKLCKEDLKNINKIYIVACGTAYHAGLVGKELLESKLRIPVTAEIASEFRYKNPIIDESTLLIVISQSGETADTLAAAKLAKQSKTRVLSIVNVVGSSIARLSDDILYTLAGPEIAVASTKAFSSQVIAMYLITLHIGLETEKLTKQEYNEIKKSMEQLPHLIETVLDKCPVIESLAKKYLGFKNAFFIGRGADYVIAMEGSLKIKEIAYVHAEAFAAGELKHGPIALLEDKSLLIGIVTQENLFDKTVSNLKECKSRGCNVLAITMEDKTEIEHYADDVFYIPRTNTINAALLANISLQLFAYYSALLMGNDIDKPRNLAKSVTVE